MLRLSDLFFRTKSDIIKWESVPVIQAASNKTVNGFQVPVLSDSQLLAIYNATVAGKAVTITDATGSMHFSGITADIVSGEVYVSFVYFDKMVLEYGEGNVTNFTALGGGHLYEHNVILAVGDNGLNYVGITFKMINDSPISLKNMQSSAAIENIGLYLKSRGFEGYNNNNKYPCIAAPRGYGTFDPSPTNVICLFYDRELYAAAYYNNTWNYYSHKVVTEDVVIQIL